MIYKSATSNEFVYEGRTSKLNDSIVALISPGASTTIQFSGKNCELFLKSEFKPYNYIDVELDGLYLGRFKIQDHLTIPYLIEAKNNNKMHVLKIVKSSEASNGAILFKGMKAENFKPMDSTPKKHIEFIGDSITCGAQSDSTYTPCNSGEYFDHHNLYLSYGLRVGRKLDMEVTISAVSGIGVYRNWNDENIEEPIISQVYENLRLDTDTSKPNDFSKKPDVLSICLGTNDLSEGDGIKPRKKFDRQKFIANYISFIETIHKKYPNTKIALLSSPMHSGESGQILKNCLRSVKAHFSPYFNIEIFEFSEVFTSGCSYHPSINDHQKMTSQLIPFYQTLLKN